MNYIHDKNDFRVHDFFVTRDHALNSRGYFLAESHKILLQCLHSNIKIKSILCTEDYLEKLPSIEAEVFCMSKELLSEISGFKVEYEVLFLGEMPTEVKCIDITAEKILVLNGLTSPENVGSIIRSACAFKINTVIVDEKTCSPYLRRCIRVSMGNVFNMSVVHSRNIYSDLQLLRSKGYSLLSTANIDKAISLQTHNFDEKSCLVIGSEGHGISPEILEISDRILKIDIDSHVAHLNASNAASIFFYQMSQTRKDA